jgi:hypothetical protein
MDDAHRSRRPAGLMQLGLVVAVLLIGMLIVVVISIGV